MMGGECHMQCVTPQRAWHDVLLNQCLCQLKHLVIKWQQFHAGRETERLHAMRKGWRIQLGDDFSRNKQLVPGRLSLQPMEASPFP